LEQPFIINSLWSYDPITLKSSASIYALGFLEAGSSYPNFKAYNPFDLSLCGVGLRVFMPAFGLLGIDFGHGFDALPGQIKPNGWETHGQQFYSITILIL
jgi:outer membrane protein insertion porin family